ncbi:hypothetical protein V6N11_044117 [Hibiscus sabdariffa]|uniref:Uncharacterized protein n=1 Tax=Hibiscus sabdariffa TaxID=183260 RepID=A0ABR2RE83_9ROSI
MRVLKVHNNPSSKRQPPLLRRASPVTEAVQCFFSISSFSFSGWLQPTKAPNALNQDQIHVALGIRFATALAPPPDTAVHRRFGGSLVAAACLAWGCCECIDGEMMNGTRLKVVGLKLSGGCCYDGGWMWVELVKVDGAGSLVRW